MGWKAPGGLYIAGPMEPLALHFVHQPLQARFGSLGGREVVLDYGAPEAEYAAAREGAGVHDASYRECLRLTGEDRASFLHAMVTQDVNGLPVGRSAYATFLTAKGAMVADARLLKRAHDLLVELEPGLAPKVKEHLEKYLISEDAEVHDGGPGWAVLRVLGPRAAEALAAAGAEGALPAAGETRAARVGGVDVLGGGLGEAGGVPGVDVGVAREGLAAAWAALTGTGGARPVGLTALELLRVEAGLPRYGADLVDTTIPLEASLGHGISYNKGCYLGQEVIARATFRGHMNRKLVGLLLGEAEVAPGTELKVGDRKVGWVTSVVRTPRVGQVVALGYVHRDFLEPGTAVDAGGAGAKVSALPFP